MPTSRHKTRQRITYNSLTNNIITQAHLVRREFIRVCLVNAEPLQPPQHHSSKAALALLVCGTQPPGRAEAVAAVESSDVHMLLVALLSGVAAAKPSGVKQSMPPPVAGGVRRKNNAAGSTYMICRRVVNLKGNHLDSALSLCAASWNMQSNEKMGSNFKIVSH
jgi:hypothetical protein